MSTRIWISFSSSTFLAVSSLKGYEEFHSGATEEFAGIEVVDEKTIKFIIADGQAAPSNAENFQYGILSKDYYAHTTWEELVAKNEKPMVSSISRSSSQPGSKASG